MTTPLDLRLCQEDPPYFRKELAACEESIFGLESTIRNLVRLAKASVELATEYTSKQLQFADEFRNFAKQQPDSSLKSVLIKYSQSLQEVERSRKILHSHMSDMFISPLESFVKNEIQPLKEVRKNFEKSSHEADGALARYMSKKAKDQQIAEILALMFTESAFYHQNYETMKDIEPHMRDVTKTLHEARIQYDIDVQLSQELKKSLIETAHETYNPMRPAKEMSSPTFKENSTSVTKSGYLFKKGSQRVMASWVRVYTTVDGETLTFVGRGSGKGSKDDEETVSVYLRICHIKPVNNSERRFCFEIMSPRKTYLLQAENEEEMDDWIRCLKTAAQEAFSGQLPSPVESDADRLKGGSVNGSTSASGNDTNGNGYSSNRRSIQRIKELRGNDLCVDCKASDPQWACANFGTLLCIECSGIHRSLGVHVSKVRSLSLDKWEPEAIEVMLRLGNTMTNKIFEANITSASGVPIANPASDRSEKEKFIIAKYVKKEFLAPKDDNQTESIDLAFWKSMSNSDLYSALRYLALGANVDWKNHERNSTTALHQAILCNDDVVVEFLLQWFCDIDAIDYDGWSGLHHAAATNNARLLLTLMKRHANVGLKDKNGKIPLDIAVELQHVQAVTALRLYQFESQLTRSEFSSFGVDEALTSVSKPYPTVRSSPSSLEIVSSTTGVQTTPPVTPDDGNGRPDDAKELEKESDEDELQNVFESALEENNGEDLRVRGLKLGGLVDDGWGVETGDDNESTNTQ
ncbi:4814_t:CDS:10 [Paraglomus brasilianum]|uniref:4814_t:CDS:1 n=1 Tax=Paraglomus brasilianum TaxID=144538 RepID=A0A9N8WC32_9GLOM|nr:4814_t:CDS:10 [Paraglomus brasilianum]